MMHSMRGVRNVARVETKLMKALYLLLVFVTFFESRYKHTLEPLRKEQP
jgi:hypothetical protein